MSIRFVDFDLDESMVAKTIYGNHPHETTKRGAILDRDIGLELRQFLSEFNAAIKTERPAYYRIDAFIDQEKLWILEVNASFVDGWGTALNLGRAARIFVEPKDLVFPRFFAVENTIYSPELELLIAELKIRGLSGQFYDQPFLTSPNPIYVYGRVGSRDYPNVLPYDGLRLDNKVNLALVSQNWQGHSLKTPKHYLQRWCSWEELPKNVVLKFCNKSSPECQRAGQSVLFGKPSGQAPFLRRCYRNELLLAQEPIPNPHGCQLIILAIGDKALTGYIQYSWQRIINDNSVHGPLKIN